MLLDSFERISVELLVKMIASLVGVLLISFYGVQVDCKVERYSLDILERGTQFREIVEVDIDAQTEVFRVPQHNDVDAMDMMNDFNLGLTVRRMPSAGVCYVSHLDLSIPRPEQIKFSMEQMSIGEQSSPSNMTIKRTGWKVVGLASRFDLPQKFIDFCGGFPLFRVEKSSLDFDTVKSLVRRGHGRGRRGFELTNMSPCTPEGKKKWLECMEKQNKQRNGYWNGVPSKFDMECTYETFSCFYVYTCKPKGGNKYYCDQEAHFLNYAGLCCKPIC